MQDQSLEMYAWAGQQLLKEREGTKRDQELLRLRSALRKALSPDTFPIGSPQRDIAKLEQEALIQKAQSLGYETPRQQARSLALDASLHVSLGL